MKFCSTFLATVLVCATGASFAPLSYAAGSTYCCSGANGRRVCGDILPQECYGRVYREVDSGGNLLRQFEAPLTGEQIAQRQAEAQRKKEEEHAAMEQRRKDQALLNTYANEKDIDFMRNRALIDIDTAIAEIQTKLTEALKRKQTLAEELEFYRKNPVPSALAEQIKANDSEIKAQQIAIDAKSKEKEKVSAYFDAQKKRYLELTLGSKGVATANTSKNSSPSATPAGTRSR